MSRSETDPTSVSLKITPSSHLRNSLLTHLG